MVLDVFVSELQQAATSGQCISAIKTLNPKPYTHTLQVLLHVLVI